MKQIPSQFIDDEDYDELNQIKSKKEWTWKDLILFHIGKEKKEVEKNETKKVKYG